MLPPGPPLGMAPLGMAPPMPPGAPPMPGQLAMLPPGYNPAAQTGQPLGMMPGSVMPAGAPMTPYFIQLSARAQHAAATRAHRTTGQNLRGLQPEADTEDDLSNGDCPCDCEGQSLPVYSVNDGY